MFSDRLKHRLQTAEAIAVFTGAGMSAESGVPTFRGQDGLWKKFKPEELANFDAFIRNPNLVWEWYKHRKELMASIQPNAGHVALAQMESLFPSFMVITQNIDNLHQRAGSHRVCELHGNIERNYCIGCGRAFSNPEIMQCTAAPRCTVCHSLIRPDVVWFGEVLPEDEWNNSIMAAERADVVLAVGTSAIVYPAATIPLAAKHAGAYVVEINLEPTDLSPKSDEIILGKSGEVLPELLAYVRTIRGVKAR